MVKRQFQEQKKQFKIRSKEETELNRKFDKEFFKRSVLYNVKTLYRRTIEEATPQQIFQAVSYAVKDAIIDAWLATQK